MAGRDIERMRASGALAVNMQHPILVLFAVSPALVLIGAIWWLAGAGWAVLAAIALLVAGGAFVVFKK